MTLFESCPKYDIHDELCFCGFDYDDIDYQQQFIRCNLFVKSDILSDDEQIELSELVSTSLEVRNVQFESVKLIFNAKKDGFTHDAFYKKCGNKCNTLIIIQSVPTLDNDYDGNKILFGGFTTKEWTVSNHHVEDKYAFLYRLRANEYGARVFRIKNYEEFALYQPPSPQKRDDTNDTNEIFYFGQPTALFLSQHCNQNEDSYCDGGRQSNYDIPFKGSILGCTESSNFRVINFEVFHFV